MKQVTSTSSEARLYVSKWEEIAKDVDRSGSVEHLPSTHCPICREPMLFTSYQYQCINKHVTNPCSATVLPLFTAIVYKCSQCEVPVSDYYDVPEYLRYLISKNCIFCGGTIPYCSYI